ncbi:L,D-transpeptidase [Paenibacillus aurantiacus]|uniref:L,D-transpeptidase n=1 Tax=Paenibacillus aurantiacus TaxID=1936118 RepID=A0ABV5KGP0_9BACL
MTQPDSATAQTAKPSPSKQTLSIRIDLSANQLFVLSGTKVTKTFAIASGKKKGLTPTGTFAIITKIKNPYYSGKNIPGGDPANPLGTRWMGLDVPNTNGTKYGIHGTNVPSSIGQYVSAGCIRMLQKDVEWLYDAIPSGTKVVIED